MERLWEDGYYTEELMRCWGLMQARREHMSQRNVKDDPHLVHTQKTQDTKWSRTELNIRG